MIEKVGTNGGPGTAARATCGLARMWTGPSIMWPGDRECRWLCFRRSRASLAPWGNFSAVRLSGDLRSITVAARFVRLAALPRLFHRLEFIHKEHSVWLGRADGLNGANVHDPQFHASAGFYFAGENWTRTSCSASQTVKPSARTSISWSKWPVKSSACIALPHFEIKSKRVGGILRIFPVYVVLLGRAFVLISGLPVVGGFGERGLRPCL